MRLISANMYLTFALQKLNLPSYSFSKGDTTFKLRMLSFLQGGDCLPVIVGYLFSALFTSGKKFCPLFKKEKEKERNCPPLWCRALHIMVKMMNVYLRVPDIHEAQKH